MEGDWIIGKYGQANFTSHQNIEKYQFMAGLKILFLGPDRAAVPSVSQLINELLEISSVIKLINELIG